MIIAINGPFPPLVNAPLSDFSGAFPRFLRVCFASRKFTRTQPIKKRGIKRFDEWPRACKLLTNPKHKVRRDYHQSFAQPGFCAEKKKGTLWRFSAYFPVFKAEEGPKEICAKPWLPVIRA